MEISLGPMNELQCFLKREFGQRGWSLRDAEAALGISRTALTNLIKHEGVIPTPETLVKLNAKFGVPVWRLLKMTGLDLGLNIKDGSGTVLTEDVLSQVYDQARKDARSMTNEQIAAARDRLNKLIDELGNE